MDLKTADKFMMVTTVSLAAIDLAMVFLALSDRTMYDTLKIPIILLTIVSLLSCFVGYRINQAYLKSPQ